MFCIHVKKKKEEEEDSCWGLPIWKSVVERLADIGS